MSTPHSPNIGRSRSALIGAFLALGLLGAACGGDSEEAAAPAVASLPDATPSDGAADDAADADAGGGGVSEEDAEAAQLRFDQCMLDEGVDQEELFGDADEGGSVVVEANEFDFEAYETALETCEPILEAVFGDFTLSPEQAAEQADIEARFDQCMLDRGFDMGDGSIELDESQDPADIEAALEVCGEVFDELNEALAGESGE